MLLMTATALSRTCSPAALQPGHDQRRPTPVSRLLRERADCEYQRILR
jgi:hypothetical protein